MAKEVEQIEVHRLYEPDVERMLRALRTILDWKPVGGEQVEQDRDRGFCREQQRVRSVSA